MKLVCWMILTFLGNLGAQSLDFELSKDIYLRKHDEYQGLIHSDSSGYIIHLYERSGKGLLNQPGRKLILEKYDKQLELTYSYEYGGNGMISLELISIGSSLVWIVMEKVSSYKYAYSMIPIGPDGKEGKKQLLFSKKINKAEDIPFTYLSLSPDSTQLAFNAVFDANKKKKEVEVYTAVINNQGAIVWDKFTELKGNQKQYQISEFAMTNDGAVLLLAKYYKNDKGKNTVRDKQNLKQAGYTMNILEIKEQSKFAKSYPLNLEGSFVHQASIMIDSTSGHIFCSGMTSAKSGGNISGVFTSEFDKQLNLIKNEQRKFSNQDLITLHKKDADVKFKANQEGLDDDYKLCRVLYASDGGITIVAEENFLTTTNFYTGGMGFNNNSRTGSTTLNSHEVVMVKISPDGDIVDLNLIPKKQSTLLFQGRSYFNPDINKLRLSDLFLSHSIMTYEDELYFFYNEHRDNFDERGSRKTVERLSRMQAAVVRTTTELDTELNALFSENENAYLLAPTRSKQISSNTYFISLVEPRRNSDKNIKIGVVTFK